MTAADVLADHAATSCRVSVSVQVDCDMSRLRVRDWTTWRTAQGAGRELERAQAGLLQHAHARSPTATHASGASPGRRSEEGVGARRGRQTAFGEKTDCLPAHDPCASESHRGGKCRGLCRSMQVNTLTRKSSTHSRFAALPIGTQRIPSPSLSRTLATRRTR